MYTTEREKIQENLASWGEQCMLSGEDKYVALTYKGDLILKNYLELSEYDVVFGKIVLLWEDSSLIYKYKEYEPFKKTKKGIGTVKFKNTNGENEKYKILFLPQKNKYVIKNPNSKLFFNKIDDAKKFVLKYQHCNKFDRDRIYGII